MVNRVLLNINGLKVSVPGANVLTAIDADLTFNSDFTIPIPLQKGQFQINAWAGTGQPTPTTTINFTKTFNLVPISCFFVDVEFNQGLLTGNQHFGSHRRDLTGDADPNTRYWYDCTVHNDRFVFRNHWGGGVNSNLIVEYFIWSHD